MPAASDRVDAGRAGDSVPDPLCACDSRRHGCSLADESCGSVCGGPEWFSPDGDVP
jgi:hypothetical protein